MVKRRTPPVVEEKLKETNKELRAQVRQLRKQLKLAEQELENVRDLITIDMISKAKSLKREEHEARHTEPCQACGGTDMDITQLGVYERRQCLNDKCGLITRSKI